MSLITQVPVQEITIKQGHFDFTAILRCAETIKDDSDSNTFSTPNFTTSIDSEEIFRDSIDPGFIQELDWFEYYLIFTPYVVFTGAATQTFTYSWQVRPVGEDWTDIVSSSTVSVTASGAGTENEDAKDHGFFETPITSRFDVRLIATCTKDEDVTSFYFSFGESTGGSLRVVGTLD